jgi:hypothetical protein
MPYEEHQKEGLFFADCLAFDGKKNGKKASLSRSELKRLGAGSI